MNHADHATALGQPVEAVCFTSDDGTAMLQARLNLRSGLVVGVTDGTDDWHEFHFDPEQADALGRWLVAKAGEYRGEAPHVWVTIPSGDEIPASSSLAGFDTLDQALAVVAGLSGLEAARAV